MSHRLRLLIAASLVGIVAGACSQPGFVFDRPELENCVPDTVVSLPLGQAHAESRSESQAGVDCFEQSVDSGQPVEIQMILMKLFSSTSMDISTSTGKPTREASAPKCAAHSTGPSPAYRTFRAVRWNCPNHGGSGGGDAGPLLDSSVKPL
jgi:hypothetical protein